MKIVFLAPFGIRPKGTLIARMLPIAAELQALGHEVVVVAPPYTNPEDSGKVEMVRGVRLRNIRLGPFSGAAAGPVLAWRMFRATRDEQPKLVHLFKPKGYGGLAAMLMIVLRRIGLPIPPVVVDTDDWEGKGGMNDLLTYSFLEKRMFAFQESWLLRRACGVTTASRALEEMVRELAGAEQRVIYLPNCVENSKGGDGAVVRERYGIPADAAVLLLYTRFFEFRQEKLQRILAEVWRRVPQLHIMVVGKGRGGEENLLRRAAEAEGFASALIMAGWVEPEDIPDYLAAGDVAIYPFDDTLINRTKCPAKLTELLLAGIPVVADRVGQVAEYLGHAPDLLCDPEEWDAMAAKAADLILDERCRRTAGAAAREFLLAKFSWGEWVVRLQDYYNELTERNQ